MRTNKRRRKRKGGFLMTTGLLLIAAALLLTLYNTREQQRADAAAAAALGQMRTVMPQEENETQTLALPAAQASMICTPVLPFCAETTRSAAGSGASGVSGKRNSCFVLSTPSMAKTS